MPVAETWTPCRAWRLNGAQGPLVLAPVGLTASAVIGAAETALQITVAEIAVEQEELLQVVSTGAAPGGSWARGEVWRVTARHKLIDPTPEEQADYDADPPAWETAYVAATPGLSQAEIAAALAATAPWRDVQTIEATAMLALTRAP